MGKFLLFMLLTTSVACNKFALSGCGNSQTNCVTPSDPTPPPETDPCDPMATPFGHGDGSLLNPFRICSEAQFLNLGLLNQAGMNFRQTTNLNFTATTFIPIGDGVLPFEGSYDGLGHELEGITYNSPADLLSVGIFRLLGTNSVIKNLTILNISMIGNEETGGLAGQSKGLIDAVTLTGTVTGNAHVGGLVGKQSGNGLTITNSQTTAMVTSLATSLSITNTDFINRVSVSGAGGIIGTSYFDMTLRQLISHSNVTWTLARRGMFSMMGSGGIVGATSGKNTLIEFCHTTGTIIGPFDVGGVIGNDGSGLTETTGQKGNLTAAMYRRLSTSATVQGPNVVGGILGFLNGGTLHQSYSTGIVRGKVNIGGAIGAATSGTVTESFSASTIQEPSNTYCQAMGGFLGQVFTSPFNFTVNISNTFSAAKFNVLCSGYGGVAAFIGNGAGVPNLSYNRLGTFVTVNTNFTTKAYGQGGSNPALLTNSVYYQNAAVPSENTAGVVAVTNPNDMSQYLTSLDFSTPRWRLTFVNPFNTVNHAVPAWVCTLEGVTCI